MDKKKKLKTMEAAWEGESVYSGNPADICDALQPKLLSGEIRVKEAEKYVSDKV